MQDVEDEVAVAAFLVGHEGASGRRVGMDRDRRNVDPVGAQPLEIDQAEIVVADAADHAAGLPEARHLVDEDRRRPAREWANQRAGLEKALAAARRHDLDQDLAKRDHGLHRRLPPF